MTALPTLDLERLVKIISWADTPDSSSEHWWKQSTWADFYPDRDLENELQDLLDKDQHEAFDKRVAQAIRDDACGSTGCIAGHTVHDAGYRLIYNSEFEAFDCILQHPTHEVDDKGRVLWEDVPDTEPESIPSVARRLLGLTEYESSCLFDGENSLDRIKSWVNVFADARGLPIPYQDSFDLYDRELEDYSQELRALTS